MQFPKTEISVNSFGAFNIHRQHNSAALSWIYNSADVSNFIIERSYDGTFFHTVDQVGVSNGHWNKFLDTTVEPGTIYYRITAVLNDGTSEQSAVETVKIVRHK